MSTLTTVADAERVVTGAHALADFVAAFGQAHLAADLAERLTCFELEALAGLLEATGQHEAAEIWRDIHAETDEEGDLHYREEILAIGGDEVLAISGPADGVIDGEIITA